MAKDAATEFYYCIDGRPYLLTLGENGVTKEIVTVLRDSYESERLNNRYEDELLDPAFKFSQTLFESNPHAYADDPVDSLMDLSQSPETVLFKEENPPSMRDRVRDLIPQLIPAQQELFWQLCEGRQLVDIAREEGTTDNAIRSRRRKMIDRLRALYKQTYGDE
jgi:DNA-binding CsgD family transcriptional regulator